MKENIKKGNSLFDYYPNSKRNLLIASSILLGSVQLLANTNTLALRMHVQNAPLTEVFDSIKAQTNMSVIYNVRDIDPNHRVSIHSESQDLSQILDKSLAKTNLTYSIRNNHIVLSEKSTVNEVKQITIKGVVRDNNQEPLIGVNVIIKGTTTGVLTGLDGDFQLTVPDSNSELVISYVGYKNQTIRVGNKVDFNITLKEDTKLLSEVVVTAMGIERQSKSLTYTAQSVGGSELTRVKDANLINSLQGKSAGLVITPNSNGAGGSSKILLRGNKSIFGNNNPLVVVDGIPMANNTNDNVSVVYGGGRDGGDALSTLNPDDIASMTILKGASAAALYGSVAANGVIMITTKKGNEGKIKVSFSSNMTIENVFNLPQLQNKYGAIVDVGSGIPDKYSWNGPILETPAKNQIADFFQTGYNLNNSIALSGGSQNSQTYFSYGNTTAQGVMPTNTFMRHNITARQNFQLFDKKLSFDFSANYIFSSSKNRPGSGMLDNPLVGLYVFPRNGNFDDFKNNYYFFDDKRMGLQSQRWLTNYAGLEEHNQNPYWMLKRNLNKDERHRFAMSGTAQWKIYDGLSLKGRLSYERDNSEYRHEKYATTFRMPMGGYGYNINAYAHSYGDILLSYNKTFNKIQISATAGSGFTYEHSSGVIFNAEGEPFEWITIVDQSDGSIKQIPKGDVYFPNHFNPNNYYSLYNKDAVSRKRMNSVFGTLQVGYGDIAYIDVTARNDWSSTLAHTLNKNMSFFYPSFGGSVLLNNLFKMDQQTFNLVKVRGSYSVVGNALPAYLSLALPTVKGTSILEPTVMPFVDLKPEKTHSVEAGIDLDLFSNHLHWDFTFYKTNTKNQFFQVDAPMASGFAKRNINAGNIQNLGIETSLNYFFEFGNDWSWTPTLNFSYNKNKVIELCEGISEYTLADAGGVIMRLKKGGSYGDIYTRDIVRDENGVIQLDDKGNPMKSPSRDVYAGNLNAKFRLGWSNTVRWKDLTLYALIDGKIGGKVLSMTEAVMDGYGVSKRTGIARDNGGVPRGDGTMIDAEAYYTSIGARAQNSAYAGKEYIYDATSFRLRELSVGYTFRNVFGISKDITASLIGRNLFFLYKDAPCDPDVSGSTGNGWQGLDVFSMPTTRSFGVNLKLTF